MLRLLHDKELPEAFNVDPKEKDELIALVGNLIRSKTPNNQRPLTWTLERIWIDERFSDNLKAFAVFLLGYSYAQEEKKGGDYGRDSTA